MLLAVKATPTRGPDEVHALAERHRIGVIDPVPHLTPAALELYRARIDATYLMVGMANAPRIDHGRPAGPPPTPLALRHWPSTDASWPITWTR